MQLEAPDPEYSLKTVSGQTGIPESTLRYWCSHDLIDARLGRRRGRLMWLVAETELERLVAQQA